MFSTYIVISIHDDCPIEVKSFTTRVKALKYVEKDMRENDCELLKREEEAGGVILFYTDYGVYRIEKVYIDVEEV